MSLEVRSFSGRKVVCLASLPAAKPGITQLAFAMTVTGNQLADRLVVEIPSEKRIDLAMALLSADGAKVKVSLTYAKDCVVCGKQVNGPRGAGARPHHKKCEAGLPA